MASLQPSQIRTIDNLHGPAGRLEALLNTGSENSRYAAMICHPHPGGGGTMHNKVVYHAMKVFASLGVPSLRFNFRGTGLSEGTHDDGRGEQEDVGAAIKWLEREYARPILFAGFSFGSHVGLRRCCGDPRVCGLIGLGLPVSAEGRRYEYGFLSQCVTPKLFVSGDHDQFAPADELDSIWGDASEPKRTEWIAGADHFFQGTDDAPGTKLKLMQGAVQSWLQETFGL